MANGTNSMKTKTDTGLLHIYCGDGKGKTTCAMGLCTRAAGAGLKVLICQFMKDNSTSERNVLASCPTVTWLDGPEKVRFSFQMSEEEKAQTRIDNDARLESVMQQAAAGGYDVLLLDEAVYAVRAGLLDEEKLIDLLRARPAKLEVILTGQGPSQRLQDEADYISEIRKVKHPFDRGLAARRGIER